MTDHGDHYLITAHEARLAERARWRQVLAPQFTPRSSAQRREDAMTICNTCNGSGEGYVDGTKCYACNGAGEIDNNQQE